MIRFRAFGTLDLRDDSGDEIGSVLAQPRRLALLAYLAVAAPRGFHRRDRLLALFWSERDEEHARASLSRACYFLRRELGEGVLVGRGAEEIGLRPDRFWCDATAFGALLSESRPADALELYRGDLLPGFFASNAPAFDSWLETERTRLRGRAADAAWTLTAREESAGNFTGAAEWGRRGVVLDPFSEAGVRRLMAILDRAGDRSGAARAYDRFVAQLASELELAPSPETSALMDAIRARTTSHTAPRATHPHDGGVTRDGGLPEHAPSVNTLSLGGERSTRRRRLTPRRLMTVVAIASVGGVGFVAWRAQRAPIDPSLAVVETLHNATGDRAIDSMARVASDRIAVGLTQSGAVGRVIRVGELGSLRPAYVVSGTLTRARGKLALGASVTDRRRRRDAWPVPAIVIDEAMPERAIDEVRQRVVGGVAALRDERFASYIQRSTGPPTFDAYQEFVEATALDTRASFQEALRHYRWATALDSTFTWSLVTGAMGSLFRGTEQQTDSLLSELSGIRYRLPALQRHVLDYMLATRAENWTAACDAIREAARLVPERFAYLLAVRASSLNRPRETVAALTQPGLDSVYRDAVQTYWLVRTLAFHQLGEHRAELASARLARRNRPQSASALAQEIRALAALGRLDAVRARLDTVLALPRDGWFTPAEAFVAAGIELRAHGHDAAAAEAFARAIAWHRARPNDERSSELRRTQYAFALYEAGSWDEAAGVFHALSAAKPDVPEYLGPLGTIAARRGDRTTAMDVARRLSRLERFVPLPGQEATLWQAKIAALLGDFDDAMRHLVDTFGDQGSPQLHGDTDFAHMQAHRSFREFVRPKG